MRGAKAGPVTAGATVQALALSRRSILGTFRQPQNWIPGFAFPLLLAAVYAAQFQRATQLEGFPEVDSFLQFLLPATVLQACIFGAVNGASDLALDIENGFFDRLLAAPVSRTSILVGRLSGSALFAAVQAAVIMVVFLAFGARAEGGVAAVVVILAVAVLLAVAIGALAAALALRTGSQEAVQSVFPLLFVLIFVSSAFFPTSTMTGWYRVLAERNPITWVMDPTRNLTIVGWDTGEALAAVVLSALLAVAAVGVALVALRRRLGAS